MTITGRDYRGIPVTNQLPAFAAREHGKTRGAIGFSLNFLVTFSFKRKSDKQLRQKKRQIVNKQIPLFLTLVTLKNDRSPHQRNRQLPHLIRRGG